MKKVTLYRAYDGTLFDSEQECAEHERYMLACHKEQYENAKRHYEEEKTLYEGLLAFVEHEGSEERRKHGTH